MSTTPNIYWYAGLKIASTLALPELPSFDTSALADLTIHAKDVPTILTGLVPDWHHDWLEPHDGLPSSGTVSLSGIRIGHHYGLIFPGVAQAWFDTTGDVAFWHDPEASVESLRHVLLDQILPRLLAQRGQLVLHGSLAATPDNQLVVIIGNSGMGKSTLASAFALAGGAVLTDDCLSVEFEDDRVRAIPSYPGLRLWPDSLTAMFPSREAEATPMAHYSNKKRLPSMPSATRPRARSIDAILVLQHADGSDAVELSPVSPQQACMALITNSFQLDLGDLRHTHKLLGLAAELARQVPVFALHHPRDYSALPRVVEHVCTQLRQATAPRAT